MSGEMDGLRPTRALPPFVADNKGRGAPGAWPSRGRLSAVKPKRVGGKSMWEACATNT